MNPKCIRFCPFGCIDIVSATAAVAVVLVVMCTLSNNQYTSAQVSAFCSHNTEATINARIRPIKSSRDVLVLDSWHRFHLMMKRPKVSNRRFQFRQYAMEPSTDREQFKKVAQQKEEFDKPCAGESCSLDHHDDPKSTFFTSTINDEDIFYLNSQPVTITQQNSLLNPVLAIPIITPFLAYLTYDDVARVFSAIFDILALERKWVPVDGGAYQAKIIAPAINGIVVPAISILFATLTSNTVSTLRQRQIDIHTYLNSEAGDLRLLALLLDVFPESGKKAKCRQYLDQYTCRLIAESEDSKVSKVMFGSTDSEMNGFVAILNELIVDRDGESSPPGAILSESFGAVVRLNTIRSSRITALQSTFPVLHYGILTLLAASICLAFLLETNQELLIFLNAIQLRILWTMLIGAISALGVVCWDLSFPFTGSYVISNAVDQLKTIRDTLRVGMEQEKKE